MRKELRALARAREDAQALIFFALTAGFLALTTGLVIEAGRLFTIQRQMQSATDMAALIGAQKLPNAAAAKLEACQYAKDNGFDQCTLTGTSDNLGGTSTTTVCAPPASKQPYSWSLLNYGSTGSCTATGSAQFIEVQISENLGSIPIFNIPITLFTHAVARNGLPGISDYAIVALDPAASQEMKFHDNGPIVTNGSLQANSSSNTSVQEAGSRNIVICNGSFYVSSTELDPGQTQTTSKGTLGYAPATCTPDGSFDSPANWLSNLPPIADPYFNTAPPTVTSPASDGNTYWLDRSTTPMQWFKATDKTPCPNGDTCELFPGVYPNGFNIPPGSNIIFNPGIYQWGCSGNTGSGCTGATDGSITINSSGSMCIYGSAACDRLIPSATNVPGLTTGCSNTTFSSVAVSRTWYYYCSPWGTFDTKNHPASATFTPPTFVDSSGTPITNSYLNGVTFVIANAPSKGFGGSGANWDLAAPNPCPGTGVYSVGSVDFVTPVPDAPSVGGGVGTYTATGVTAADNVIPPVGSMMYPNPDLTIDGECSNPGYVWKDEFGSGSPSQHLHFLVLAQNNTTSVKFQGNGIELFFGIVHTFPTYTTTAVAPTTACAACSVSFLGTSGADNGPPAFMGQVIANNEDFGGDAVIQVFNRPGGQATGPGTSLVQ